MKIEDQFKVINKVYEITYPCLTFVDGNREIHEKHSEELKKAIIEGAQFPPILVDRKTLKIIDGQHRYDAFCLALEERI